MRWGTKRPQNVCETCGHTWYPRGSDVSISCPNCGNRDVKLAGCLGPVSPTSGGGMGGCGQVVVLLVAIGGGLMLLAGGGCVLLGFMSSTKSTPSSSSPSPQSSASTSAPSGSTPAAPAEPRPKVSDLIPYRILERKTVLDEKVSYDILVNLVGSRLPTMVEMSAIARFLDDGSFKRCFVGFYLPGMKVDAGAFARSHRTPEHGKDRDEEVMWYFLVDYAEYARLVPTEHGGTMGAAEERPGIDPERAAHERLAETLATAEASLVRGDFVAARKAFDEVLAKAPPDSEMATTAKVGRSRAEVLEHAEEWYSNAELYYTAGKLDKARIYLRRLVTGAQGTMWAEKAQALLDKMGGK